MLRFEDGILGLLPKDVWLDVGNDVERPNDPVDQVFGDIKTDNLVAEWESRAAEYNLPVMAQFHAFDVEAQKTLRMPIDTHNIEKGLIKVKIDQSERLRQLKGRGVINESRLAEKTLNDGYNLAEEVFMRSKVAKNEVLATGKMTITENNLNLTVDYGVPAGNLSLVLDFGDGATKPLDEQLLDLKEASSAAGAAVNGIYTSERMLNALRKNKAIQKAVNGAGMVGQLVRNSDLREYLASEFGITRILTNDLHYSLPLTIGSDGRPHVTAKRYYPQDRISFFSADGTLGDGLWGLPPEADAEPFATAVASGDFPYVFVDQYAENDPKVVWTKASGLFIPVLYNPNALYVATYANTPGA